MHSSLFFKLFPPPKFMVMKHAGLHLSDDAIRCIEFSTHAGHASVSKWGQVEVPAGSIDGGEIKDEKALGALLRDFDKKHGLNYVKVSVPEEKSYLFQTDVPSTDIHAIAQNIEFKLEESVPLAAADALFYFDLLPTAVTGGVLRASVSVVPRAYIEGIMSLLRSVGMHPIAFEVLPKAIARAVIPHDAAAAQMLVYIMNRKTGIYIVSGGVVCFTSTIGWGSMSATTEENPDVTVLTREINRIYTYWASHNIVMSAIDKIILLGRNAPSFEETLRASVAEAGISVAVADVWHNTINIDRYIPPISHDESLDYAAAAGLAMGL